MDGHVENGSDGSMVAAKLGAAERDDAGRRLGALKPCPGAPASTARREDEATATGEVTSSDSRAGRRDGPHDGRREAIQGRRRKYGRN